MSLVSKRIEELTKPKFRIPRGQEIMADSSEINEVPISDPPATHPRSWSESSASLADQLISPTSAGSGFSLETSGELDSLFEFEIVEVWPRCVVDTFHKVCILNISEYGSVMQAPVHLSLLLCLALKFS